MKYWQQGINPPLFDRFLTKKPLINSSLDSVETEIKRILNARNSFKPGNIGGVGCHFGIPSFSCVYPTSKKSLDDFFKKCEKAIKQYEPRIQDIKIHLLKIDPNNYHVYTSIEANALIENIRKAVQFDFCFN